MQAGGTTCRRATAPCPAAAGSCVRDGESSRVAVRGGCRWLSHTGYCGSRRPSQASISSRRSAVGAGQRQVQRVADDVEPGGPRASMTTFELGGRGAVPAHRRLQLDDHPAVPSGQRGDVVARTDGQDRVGLRATVATDVGVSTTGVTRVGNAVELVDRADAHDDPTARLIRVQRRPAEAIAIALDHRHEASRVAPRSNRMCDSHAAR